MIKKMKLKRFQDVLYNISPHVKWNENKNYLTIAHSEWSTDSFSDRLEKTGNKHGRLGLVVYMKKYFGTVVTITPKRFRDGRINPHVCTVLGSKGQVLFDAFDEWFEPEIYGVAREVRRSQGPDKFRIIITPDIVRQSWDDLFEV